MYLLCLLFRCATNELNGGGFFYPGQKKPSNYSANSEDVQCNLWAILNDRYNVHIVGRISDNKDKTLGVKAKGSHKGT